MKAPARAPRPRLRTVAFTAAGVALLALGAVALANRHIEERTNGSLFGRIEQAPRAHTAIVLGARVYPDGRVSPALEDRLATALDLYNRRTVTRILVSGDHRRTHYDETNTMARWLVARGVPERDVFTDHAGFRTLDTMERAAKVFHVRDAIVCTQRFHLARSVFLAQRAGIRAVGVAADRRRYAFASRDRQREFFARAFAVLDTYVLHTGARFLGAPIPIDDDAARSRDGSFAL